jgi:hypothetical protein
MLMFLSSIIISSGTKSQTTDTLCFPRPVLEKVLIAAKQKKVQDTLISLLRSDISILEQMKSTLMAKDTTNQQIILSYKSQVGNLEQQKVILQKEVRKWKRKTTWTAIGGLVLTAATAFLFLTK